MVFLRFLCSGLERGLWSPVGSTRAVMLGKLDPHTEHGSRVRVAGGGVVLLR